MWHRCRVDKIYYLRGIDNGEADSYIRDGFIVDVKRQSSIVNRQYTPLTEQSNRIGHGLSRFDYSHR
jgi:hypothetical protein